MLSSWEFLLRPVLRDLQILPAAVVTSVSFRNDVLSDVIRDVTAC